MKLATVKRIWQELNARNFGGVLCAPRIRWNRHHKHAGKFGNALLYVARDICIVEMRETVYHEMCHQYIEEFLNINEEPAHNGLFRKTYTKFLSNDIEADNDYTI